ncbi:MAG: polysaccharide biosynthesis C-terminal domain-containing protein, partial [Candidatus Caccovivens sp.]
SQVLEQVFKFVFGLLFASFFGRFGASQGVFGAFLGITLSELVSLVYLFALFFFKKRHLPRMENVNLIKQTRREFDSANFPLTLSASILPLVNAFDGLVIVQRLMVAGYSSGLATKLFGLQAGVVGALLNFPLIISMAVTTTLLPNISYLISRGTGGRYIIEKGLKILLFLILPTTFGLVAISKQVFTLFYADMSGAILDTAFLLMFYGGFSIVFTAIMQYLIMLLQANGRFQYILIITAIAGTMKALISFFLSALASFNIFALVLGNIALSGITCLLALWKLKNIVAFKLSFADVFLLLFGTLCMFLVVYTFINCNYFSNIVNILLAVLLGMIVYMVFTIPVAIKFQLKKRV